MCLFHKSKPVVAMDTPTYFTLYELVYSETAEKNNIDNTPDWDIVDRLKHLALFLDGIREAWGGGIIVTSGYRCPDLNKKVGGVSNSVHMLGYAADIIPANGRLDEFAEFLRGYLSDRDYDQCIFEQSGKTRWIHIGLYNNKGEQRHMVFELNA